MKAIVVHAYGDPDVMQLEEIVRPKPGPGEVLVRIKATAVNPVDWKVRQGYMNHSLPFTPGWDMAGIVEETASNVSDFEPGNEVYGRPDVSGNGTYAEYMVAKASDLAKRPRSITFEEAAAIPLAGLTAWQSLFDHGNLQKGQKVFIHGASGGVGTYAVQLAKWKGAEVAGSASKDNHLYLKNLGIDQAVDYHNENFEKDFSNYDLVLDLVGEDTQRKSIPMLKKGGVLVTTVKLDESLPFKENEIRATGMFAQSHRKDLEALANLVDEGKLKASISERMPFEKAAQAHRISEKGHVRGKMVLTVS